EAIVDAPCLALDGTEVLGVLWDVLAGGIQQREERHPLVHLRMRFEVELVGTKAPDDVLRRIGSVDSYDQALRSPLDDLPLRFEHFRALRELVELLRVDRDRRSVHPRPTTPMVRAPIAEVPRRTRDVDSAP